VKRRRVGIQKLNEIAKQFDILIRVFPSLGCDRASAVLLCLGRCRRTLLPL
jgi:hypothetical protein